MDYCIKNNNNLYIRINSKGSPVTCVENAKEKFEYSKAVNILNNLPRTMKRLHFRVEGIPEPIVKEKDGANTTKIINKNDYVLSENVSRWIEKFGKCADILEEAKQRETELIEALRRNDDEFLDVLHIIELEKSKDMFSGWRLYKQIRLIREQRRVIKDELLIIENILEEINPSCLQRENVQKAIGGLFTRKYKLRVVEECDEDNT